MSKITTQTPPYHPDDIVVWPDEAWATLREVRNGEFSHRSDDFEIVRARAGGDLEPGREAIVGRVGGGTSNLERP